MLFQTCMSFFFLLLNTKKEDILNNVGNHTVDRPYNLLLYKLFVLLLKSIGAINCLDTSIH